MPVALLTCTASPLLAGTWPKMLPVVDWANTGVLASARATVTASVRDEEAEAILFFNVGGLGISFADKRQA